MAAIQQLMLAGAGAVAATQSWNPADVNAALLLSGSNLIVTRSSAANAYTTGRARYACSGKKYWEVAVTANGGFTPPFGLQGVVTASFSLSAGVGSATGGWGFHTRDGDTYDQGTQNVLGYTAIGVGDTLMVAFDTSTGKLWFGRNGTWYASGNPAAGTGQQLTVPGGNTVYPAQSLYSSGTSNTANFTGGFTYTPPTGFSGF